MDLWEFLFFSSLWVNMLLVNIYVCFSNLEQKKGVVLYAAFRTGICYLHRKWPHISQKLV